MTTMRGQHRSIQRADGPPGAALLSAAIGVFVIGLMTTLAEISAGLRASLMWYRPAGPLTGKTGLGVIAWLVSWIVFGMLYQGKHLDMQRVTLLSWILIALGLIGTFPPFFELFAH